VAFFIGTTTMIEQHYLEHRHYFQDHYFPADYYLLRLLTMIRHRIIKIQAELLENIKTKPLLIEDYHIVASG